MNKKFLSAILFGALMVTSTGTFVSCKDYDDDIENLQTQINSNKEAIAALQKLVGEGNWVTGITAIDNGIRVTMSNGQTAEITGINGEDGKDGADGTVVTIIDGFWAFDGVKSEYPAVPAESSNGQDAHEIQVSDDGYWMIWDSEAGAYEKTPYAVAPISASQDTKGNWTISVKNADGTIDNITLPATSLLSVEVVNRWSVDDINKVEMNYNYGIVRSDVKWGWKEDKVMTAGFYSKLSDDMTLLLNPAGVHGDAYTYTLKNSSRDYATPPMEITFFDTAVPFAGPALARTTSDNALWTLPAHLNVSPASDIEKIRRELYLFFKYNDYKNYNLAVEATSADGVKVISSYSTIVSPQAITGNETLSSLGAQEALIGEAYYPTFGGSAAGMIADYELRLTQTAENLKKAEVYGATVTDNAHAWIATKEAGIYNPISYDIMYILLDGSVKKIENFVQVNFTSKLTEIKEAWTLEDPTLYQGAPLNAAWNKDRGVFEYVTEDGKNYKEYDLNEFVDALDSTQKLVWNQAVEQLAKGNKTAFSEELIGGDVENNIQWNNWLVENNISYTIDKNKIRFTFSVSPNYAANFQLDKAYQYTITVVDPDNHGAGVAKIVLPFEFTLPTLDITRVDGKFTEWNKDKTALYAYGHLCNADPKVATDIHDEMRLPLYDSFTAWKAKGSETGVTGDYQAYKENAKYYGLKFEPLMRTTIFGKSAGRLEVVALDNALNYSAVDHNLNTMAEWTILNQAATAVDPVTGNADPTEVEVPVAVNYNFYGVYASGEEDFTLIFASWLKESTLATKSETYTTDRGTHQVLLTNDQIDFKTPKGGAFYLFNDLDASGVNAVARSVVNGDTFNEVNHYPFTGFSGTAATYGTKQITGLFDANDNHFKAVEAGNPKVSVGIVPAVLTTSDFEIEKTTGNLKIKDSSVAPDARNIKVYLVPSISERPAVATDGVSSDITKINAFRGGMLVVLPQNYNEQDAAIITVTLKDIWGYTNSFSFTVSKL